MKTYLTPLYKLMNCVLHSTNQSEEMEKQFMKVISESKSFGCSFQIDGVLSKEDFVKFLQASTCSNRAKGILQAMLEANSAYIFYAPSVEHFRLDTQRGISTSPPIESITEYQEEWTFTQAKSFNESIDVARHLASNHAISKYTVVADRYLTMAVLGLRKDHYKWSSFLNTLRSKTSNGKLVVSGIIPPGEKEMRNISPILSELSIGNTKVLSNNKNKMQHLVNFETFVLLPLSGKERLNGMNEHDRTIWFSDGKVFNVSKSFSQKQPTSVSCYSWISNEPGYRSQLKGWLDGVRKGDSFIVHFDGKGGVNIRHNLPNFIDILK